MHPLASLASRVLRAAAVLAALGGSFACSSRHAEPVLQTTGDAADVARASELLRADRLPDRFEVVALADRLAVAAVRDRSASSSVLLAARLRERLFRAVHAEADGREAAALFERALETSTGADACDAAVERATILGELAHDPTITLRELAGAQEKAGAACQTSIDRVATTLAAYRDRAGVSLAPRAASSAHAAIVPGQVETEADEVVASPEPPPASSEPVKVLSVKPIGDVDSARVVLHVSGTTSFRAGSAGPAKAGAGPRIYVDVAHAKLAKMKHELTAGGLVERIRLAPRGDGVRVVLDLSRPAFRRVFYLPEPFRIVIDLSTRPEGRVAAPASKGAKRSLSRVVLDPGHGGNDPGATGQSGLREKDVTLDVAHRAAPVLARELGVTTLLTRDADEYVSLEERTARANAFGADVFVSIHCNASESAAARGVQTFVLDTTSDDIAARVAARENATSAQAGAEVSRLLTDLKLADLGARSTHVAELLQRSAVASLAEKFPGTPDQGVKTAGFYVLVGAEMPAVLFETSFISNGVEEQRLASGEYRQRLADAIVNALRAWREGK